MIISPPFLSTTNISTNINESTPGDTIASNSESLTEQDICKTNIQECLPGNGAYPVSYNLGWHGGAHLVAPTDSDGTVSSVRAIADGTIVFLRQPDDPNSKPELQYGGGLTDNGCVVIRHDTKIGEGEQATITYFSIYQHLRQIQSLEINKPIYRKDVLGAPGRIYGQSGRIHFEIVCNTSNLEKIIGRQIGPLGQRTGRTDAVYGDVWFYVPSGAKLFANEPHPGRDDGSTHVARIPAVHAHHGHPAQPEQPATTAPQQAQATTDCDLVIQMQYMKDCTLTVYKKDAQGRWKISQSAATEADAEYNLFVRTQALHKLYTDGSVHVDGKIPTQSAIFEVLRFGRTLEDSVSANAFSHWRKIKTSDDHTGWIDLSASDVSVSSDADFPEWSGWSLIQDDPTPNNLCDSPTIKSWLKMSLGAEGSVANMSHADMETALHNDDVKIRLARAVCRFPTEWASDGLETRYAWLTSQSEALPNPLSQDDLNNKLIPHARALSFWEQIQGEKPAIADCWHWPLTQFIQHFRKCGWLSEKEFAQCLPRTSLSDSNLHWESALSRSEKFYIPLGKTFRKYLGSDKNRMAHFFAQAHIETGIFSMIEEGGEGDGHDYGAFYGRGPLQLTWASNYEKYGLYKGLADQAVPHYSDDRITLTSLHQWDSASTSAKKWAPRYDPQDIASNLSYATDSSGFYWVSKTFRGKSNINRAADLGLDPDIVGFISWLVNGGQTGYANRQQFAATISNALLDGTNFPAHQTLRYPPLVPASHPALCATFPPTHVDHTQHVEVTYARQIP